MKIKILNEKENPFMKRKDLEIEIDHEKGATPTKSEIQQEIAKTTKADVTNVDVRNIFSYKGMAKSKSKVYVWTEKKVDDLSKKVKKEAPKEAKEEVKEQDKEERKAVKQKPVETAEEEKPAETEEKKEEKKGEKTEEKKGEKTEDKKEDKKK
ncbi:hypothetical protein ACFLQN_03750 [Candidatus Aenigmatarchaeota archaeon]